MTLRFLGDRGRPPRSRRQILATWLQIGGLFVSLLCAVLAIQHPSLEYGTYVGGLVSAVGFFIEPDGRGRKSQRKPEA